MLRPKNRGRSFRARGRFHTAETRRKIAAAKRKPVIRTDDDVYYDSIGAAAAAIGVSHTMVSQVCRGKRAHAAGWHFEFANPEEKD